VKDIRGKTIKDVLVNIEHSKLISLRLVFADGTYTNYSFENLSAWAADVDDTTMEEYAKKPRVEVTLFIKPKITWVPEDFEGSDMTWEEFCKKMVSDLDYRKNTIFDNSPDIGEDVWDVLTKGRYNMTVIKDGEGSKERRKELPPS